MCQQLLCWDSEVEEEVDRESETSFEGGQSSKSLRDPSLVDSGKHKQDTPSSLPTTCWPEGTTSGLRQAPLPSCDHLLNEQGLRLSGPSSSLWERVLWTTSQE